MNKKICILISICLFFIVGCSESPDLKESDNNGEFLLNLTYTDEEGCKYKSFCDRNTCYLFLPYGFKTADINIVSQEEIIKAKGATVLGTYILHVDKPEFYLSISVRKNIKVKIISSDLPSVSIKLNNVTLEEINNSSKNIKYGGNSIIISSNDKKIVDNSIELKGRGNYTWKLSKKPYQFKLSEKKNILEMGKAKTWILLANHADVSFLRNKYSFKIAQLMDIDYAVDSEFVNLWVDGEYTGLYQLSEKVQVGEKRVNLTDDKGILVELDNNYGTAEDTILKSKISNSCFVLSDSVADDVGKENSKAEAAFDSFITKIDVFEENLINGTWSDIISCIDVESFVKMYFLLEFTEDPDGCRSSFFLFMDGEDDVIHLGPAWDFDSGLGSYTETSLGGNPNIDYVENIDTYMPNSVSWFKDLMSFPEFESEVNSYYHNHFKQILLLSDSLLETWKNEIIESAEMNFKVWDLLDNYSLFGKHRKYAATYEKEVLYLKTWIKLRTSYFSYKFSNKSILREMY